MKELFVRKVFSPFNLVYDESPLQLHKDSFIVIFEKNICNPAS